MNHIRCLIFSSIRYEKLQSLFYFVDLLGRVVSSRFHFETYSSLKFLNNLINLFALNERGANDIIGKNSYMLSETKFLRLQPLYIV